MWLPGAGQAPDNELLRRMLNGMHSAYPEKGVFGLIVAVPHAKAEEMLRCGGSEGWEVCVGGHSKGAGIAARLGYAARIPTLLCSSGKPPSRSDEWRCLVVLGEHDGGDALLQRGARDGGSDLIVAGPLTAGVKVIVILGGDHSLRVRPANEQNKEKYNATAETVAAMRCMWAHVQSHLFPSC